MLSSANLPAPFRRLAASPLWSQAAVFALVLTGYYGGTRFSEWLYSFKHAADQGVPFFPAVGFGFTALVLLPRRFWPAALAGVAVGEFASDWQSGLGLTLTLGFVVANVVEPVPGALLLQRLGRGRPPLTRPIDGLALLAAAGVSALAGAAIATFFNWTQGDASFNGMLNWTVGDTAGMTVITASLLLLLAERNAPAAAAGRLEWLSCGLVIAATPLGLAAGAGGAMSALVVIPVFWAAARAGARMTAFGLLVLSFCIDVATVDGDLRLWNTVQSAEVALRWIQIFVIVVVIIALALLIATEERGRALQLVSRARDRWEAIAASSPTAIIELDARGSVLFANERAEAFLGAGAAALPSLRLDDGERLAELTERTLAFGPQHDLPGNVEGPSGALSISASTTELASAGGAARRLLLVLADTRAQRSLEHLLRHQASHDALTDLPNRQRFLAHLEELDAAGSDFAVLFCDVDRFKHWNDTLGHDAGDVIIRAVAERLRRLAGADSMVARFGGDEFVVAVVGEGAAARAEALGEELVAGFHAPIATPAGAAEITISVGTAPRGAPDDVLRSADLAMYSAKRAGGDRVAVAEADAA